MGLYIGFLPSFIHSAFNSMVCVMPSAVKPTQRKQTNQSNNYTGVNSVLHSQALERDHNRASGKSPPGFLPVLRGVLTVGLGSVVSARAEAAAEC